MKNAFIILITIVFLFSNSSLKAQKRNDDKLIGTFHRYYEPSMKAWQGMDSFAFTYDKQGNKNSITQFNGDDSLYPTVKGIYTFNSKNQINTQENYFWDYANKSWSLSPNSKSTYSYNNADSLISILTETLDSITWIKNSKTDYNYDGNNNRTQELNSFWDTITKKWSNEGCQKITMTYSKNKCVSKTYYTWDTNSKQFNQSSNYFYTYNSAGNLETNINQIWDGVNAWHNSTKDSIVYDNNNVKLEEFGFNFDDVKTKKWFLTFKYSNTINVNNQINQTLLTFWNSKINSFPIDENARQITFNYNKNNNVKTIFDKRYDTIAKQFVDYNEDYFYYEIDTINLAIIKVKEPNEIKAYPNPFIDKLQIKTNFILNDNAKINLINNIGETINVEMEQKNNEITIYTNTLAKGIYILHLENKESSYLTKIIKL